MKKLTPKLLAEIRTFAEKAAAVNYKIAKRFLQKRGLDITKGYSITGLFENEYIFIPKREETMTLEIGKDIISVLDSDGLKKIGIPWCLAELYKKHSRNSLPGCFVKNGKYLYVLVSGWMEYVEKKNAEREAKLTKRTLH